MTQSVKSSPGQLPKRPFSEHYPLLTALALAMGAAISLGISRFAYALFLPLMKNDLHWTYLTAGNMNTGNAMGYLIGAISAPWFFLKFGLRRSFLWMSITTALILFLTGCVTDTLPIFLFRFLVGWCSGYIFIAGGVLATQLSSQHPSQSGLILGIYYGGVGGGILISSLLINALDSWAQTMGYTHPWQIAWIGMASVSAILWIVLFKPVWSIKEHVVSEVLAGEKINPKYNIWIGSGYLLYGIGHVGYMTFVVAMLREIGFDSQSMSLFYGLLGLCVMLSFKLWAKTLDQALGGGALGRVNLFLGIACLIPTLIAYHSNGHAFEAWQIFLVMCSAILFGACFIAAVSSTTAFVKHNYPMNQWSSGIQFFTLLFATGQMIGPFLIGLVADNAGGLPMGLLVSSVLLLLAGGLAFQQKPLTLRHSHSPR